MPENNKKTTYHVVSSDEDDDHSQVILGECEMVLIDSSNSQKNAKERITDFPPLNNQQDEHLIDNEPEATIPAKHKILAVAFYWCTSLSLTFLNKLIMDGDIINLDAPLFMSWTQFVFTVLYCIALGVISKFTNSNADSFLSFPAFEYKLSTARKIMPLTFVFLGMIVFSNLCLKLVEVSFYQVAKSMTIIMNILCTYLLLKTKTNKSSIACCVVITIGYFIGCIGEVRFSWLGIIFGLLASICMALNAIYVKQVLPFVGNNVKTLMIYNNLNAVFLLPIIIILFTDEIIEIAFNPQTFRTAVFWGITMASGIFAFLINFASYVQIKLTSPLTHNVSGTAKAAAQTIIALLLFRNPETPLELVGCGIVILGSFVYSRIK